MPLSCFAFLLHSCLEIQTLSESAVYETVDGRQMQNNAHVTHGVEQELLKGLHANKRLQFPPPGQKNCVVNPNPNKNVVRRIQFLWLKAVI